MIKNIKRYAFIAVSSMAFGYLVYDASKNPSYEVENRIKIDETVNQAIIDGEAYYQNEHFTHKIMVNGQTFEVSNSSIVRARDYNTEKMVIYIKDIHNRPGVQEEIYYTLEELLKENNVKLVGLEGTEEEKQVTREDLISSLEQKLPEIKTLYLREKVKKFISRCKLLAELHDTNSEEKTQKKLVTLLSHGLLGGYIFEVAYNDQVDSYGLEEKDLFEEAKKN